jgi:indole-3-glycerol phosphate synthase
MTTYLDRIVDRHRQLAAADTRRLGDLIAKTAAMHPTRGFRTSLLANPDIAVIAEIKRRSPSKGDLCRNLDAAELAARYATGGATCLSVLTDEEFFAGSVGDLAAARSSALLPVLRKDFTVDPRDVADARLMGADAVLLIAAVLDPFELVEFHQLGTELGLDVLIEVHDEPELEEALNAGSALIGVNQRDLMTFEVDPERAVRVAAAIPPDVVKIAESGIRDADDVRRLADAGYDAMLIGETLVTAADPVAALESLLLARR